MEEQDQAAVGFQLFCPWWVEWLKASPWPFLDLFTCSLGVIITASDLWSKWQNGRQISASGRIFWVASKRKPNFNQFKLEGGLIRCIKSHKRKFQGR